MTHASPRSAMLSAPLADAETTQETRGGFALWWRGIRNRALQSRRFQRAAMATPVGRFFARRSAARLFDLTAGFVYAQILSAGVETGLFALAAKAPLDAAEAAARLDLPVDSAARLLAGSAAIGLLDRLADGRYTLGGLGAALLANSGVSAMVRHHDAFYGDLSDPVALLKNGGGTGRLAALWDYAGGGASVSAEAPEPSAATRRYTALMEASQDLVADAALAAFDIRPFRHVLDIGGGSGRFLERVAGVNGQARLTLFDRPEVAKLAAERLAGHGACDRFRFAAGSFLTDPLPQGADLVCLVRILHDHDDDVVRRILRKARQAIAPGGTLLVAEPMAGGRQASRIGDAYFNFYLLAMGSGRARSPAEIKALLTEAGFSDPRAHRSPMPIGASIVTAHASR